MKPKTSLSALPLSALTFSALAFSAMTFSQAWADSLEDKLAAAFQATQPDLKIEQITASPAQGVSEVKLSNGDYLYATEGGRYLFAGRLIELSGSEFRDLTEERQQQDRADMLANIDLNKSITYKAQGTEQHEVFVFTDVSCGYCKNFHTHIDEIAQRGITVHYLAFPRAGVSSPVGELMGRAWCSEDQQSALTEIKSSNRLSQTPVPCRAPISEHYALAQKLGVRGTPAIFDRHGNSLGGYLDTEQLVTALSQ